MTRPTLAPLPIKLLCLLLASLAGGRVARASSPADGYGALPRGMATAGAQTASGTDSGAAFYNPANLGFAGFEGQPSIQVGYAYGHPFMSAHRDKTDAATLSQYPTNNPPPQGYVTAGVLLPVGGKIRNMLTFGLVVYLPQDKLIRTESLDPKSPQWLRYQSDTDRPVLATGFGIRIAPWLSIGLGVQVLAGLDGTVNVNADLFSKTVTERNLSFNINTAVAPTAGVSFEPIKNWRISFAYRGPLAVKVSLPTQIALGQLGMLNLLINGVLDYSPHQVVFGMQIPIVTDLNMSFDLKWEHWSIAPSPAMTLDVSTGGDIATTLGLDKALGFQTSDAPPGFVDTFNPSASIEYLLPGHAWTLRAGYAYRPTYVPNQVASTNYLDADAHIVGFGVSFQFYDGLDIFPNPIKVDVGGQAHVVSQRTVVKSQPADPVGNYNFGGTVVALAASLRYDF